MSDAEPKVHASFVKVFLPGLVLGLVVGAVGGVLLTDLVFSRQPDLPRFSAERLTGPGSPGADQRDHQPAPMEPASEAAQDSEDDEPSGNDASSDPPADEQP